MDLQDPTSKMSKSADSDAGCVIDARRARRRSLRKFKRAVTDSEHRRALRPGRRSRASATCSTSSAAATGRTVDEVAAGYTQYGPLKSDTGDAVVALLEPIQARYRELIDDRAELHPAAAGRLRPSPHVASKTLQRAYDAIGLIPA